MTDELMGWLAGFIEDPLVFLIIFFFFAVAATIILPIPVEAGLLIGVAAVPYPLLAVVLGLGKAVGSLFVFKVGGKIEPSIRRWSARWKWFAKFVRLSEAFVAKYRYYALYIILSIPLMLDTVPLYLFSLLNKDGKEMHTNWFVLTNFLAGMTRAAILGLLLYAFGINLFPQL
jgi:membrane protein DedA with SNARE-associated domain